MASTGPPELCPRLVEWMLQRPPLELLEVTEVQYACASGLLVATVVGGCNFFFGGDVFGYCLLLGCFSRSSVEMACRNLPSNTASEAAAEKLLSLALQASGQSILVAGFAPGTVRCQAISTSTVQLRRPRCFGQRPMSWPVALVGFVQFWPSKFCRGCVPFRRPKRL